LGILCLLGILGGVGVAPRLFIGFFVEQVVVTAAGEQQQGEEGAVHGVLQRRGRSVA
jgi:hypothetical protein